MKKEPRIFIAHILESIEDIESFSKGFSKEEIEKDKEKQFAITRGIEIIGEAIKKHPSRFHKHPSRHPLEKNSRHER